MPFTAAEYSKLYSGVARKLVERGTLTGMLGNSSYINSYQTDLTNYREVKKYNINLSQAGLLGYEGKYDEVGVSGEWVTYKLAFDRAMKITFDKLEREFDGNKGVMSIDTILKQVIKDKVIPEIDATNIERCWEALATVASNIASAPTGSSIINDILEAINNLEKNGLARGEQQLFVSYGTDFMLTSALSDKPNAYVASIQEVNANGITYNLPAINSVPIQKMPDNRFYSKIKRYIKADQTKNPLNVGYAKDDTGEVIAWLIVPRQYVYPITKLSDLKIKLDSVENTEDRNNKAAYNIFYDCLVEDELKPFFRGALIGASSQAKKQSKTTA